MRALSVAFGLAVLGLLLVPLALSLWLDARWFAAQNLGAVFALRLGTQLELGLLAAVAAGVVTLVSLGWATLRLRRAAAKEDRDSRGLATIVATVPAVALVVGALFGLAAFGQWQTLLGFQAQVPFGQTDPTFGQDVAFYVWTLPALAAARSWLTGLFLVVAIATGVIYGIGLVSIEPPRISTRPYPFITSREYDLRGHPLLAPAVRHLALLGALVLLLIGASYWLNNWELVYSVRGVVFGASATDMHAVYPANVAMLGVAVLLAVVLLIVAAHPAAGGSTRFLVTAAAAPLAWIVLGFLLGEVWPGVYEQFAVRPQQLAAERPYIENNIGSTRQAMDLERIEVRDLTGDGTLDSSVLSRNQSALSDVRITDWRPLQAAYNQLQRIRQYYEFVDIDVDRYPLRSGQQQVMLSARELDPNSLAQVARTWQNTHLIYTHGQGVVVAPVNRVTGQGLPELLASDIPVTTGEPALRVDRPQIYFGALPVSYAVVGTRLEEFDRPGDNNSEVRNRYEGGGGVQVGSGPTRLATAAALGDGNLLLSGDISDASQLLLHRQVQERVSHVAPFLRLDADPYEVILDGHLLWVQDAYTWTNRYPDATPQAGANYLRNSVKVTVDDYDGSMHFYVMQPDDPILRVWMRLYPTLFTPLDQAPTGLAAHFRYPEDLFNTQASLLATYHMTDPQTFYNREDLWNIAQETFGDRVQQMQAYFTSLRLPGEADTEFATILPFTPAGQNRNNMVAWMAARSDGPNYGQLRVYRFPQGKLVFGPQQIEARINQEPAISSQITLLNQQGSQVLRGNLLVIPLEDSVLYVQPMYIQAQSNPLPELKRVIVASTGSVVMSDQLSTALTALGQGRSGEVLAASQPQAQAQAAPASGTGQATDQAPPSSAALATSARDHLRAAEAAAGRGDWASYGTEMATVHQLLDQLASAASGT